MRPSIEQTLRELEQQRLEQSAAMAEPGSMRDLDSLMLAVGPDTGRFLNTLIRATRAVRVLEIGGSMGYSTIFQGEAVEANGGRLWTLEAVPAKVDVLRRRIEQADLAKTVQIIQGDARKTIATVEGPLDLVLVDAWKQDYPKYFDLVFPRLRVGGLIVADNITYPAPPDAGILEYVHKARNHPAAQSQLIPIGSGLELTTKLVPFDESAP